MHSALYTCYLLLLIWHCFRTLHLNVRNVITNCVTGAQKDLYYTVGKMMSFFIIHGSPVPEFFSTQFYSTLMQNGAMKPTTDDITDNDVRVQLIKVVNTTHL